MSAPNITADDQLLDAIETNDRQGVIAAAKAGATLITAEYGHIRHAAMGGHRRALRGLFEAFESTHRDCDQYQEDKAWAHVWQEAVEGRTHPLDRFPVCYFHPLITALTEDFPEVANCMLQSITDNKGRSEIFPLACEANRPWCVALLLEKGIDQEALNYGLTSSAKADSHEVLPLLLQQRPAEESVCDALSIAAFLKREKPLELILSDLLDRRVAIRLKDQWPGESVERINALVLDRQLRLRIAEHSDTATISMAPGPGAL